MFAVVQRLNDFRVPVNTSVKLRFSRRVKIIEDPPNEFGDIDEGEYTAPNQKSDNYENTENNGDQSHNQVCPFSDYCFSKIKALFIMIRRIVELQNLILGLMTLMRKFGMILQILMRMLRIIRTQNMPTILISMKQYVTNLLIIKKKKTKRYT